MDLDWLVENWKFIGGLVVGVIVGLSLSFLGNKIKHPNQVTAQYSQVGIMLPDGHLISTKAAKGDGEIFISEDVLAGIIGKNVQWNKKDKILYVGKIPNAKIMSKEIGDPYQATAIEPIFGTKLSKDEIMIMGNEQFNLGYAFGNTESVEFNLDGKYEKLKGKLGVEDNTCAEDGIVEVYLDDQLYQTFNVKPKDFPQDVLLDVEGANKMSIVFKNFRYSSVVNFADVYIR